MAEIVAPTPFNEGLLDRQDGHQIYFAEYGDPNGKPFLMFHGGPGSRSKSEYAIMFNLDKFRVIMFDQRGCGKSIYTDRFKNNDTTHILDDAKAILDHLGIQKTSIQSGSWGAALSLLFAQKYPEMVNEMILSSVFLARQDDLNWMNKTSGLIYPDIYENIAVPENNNVLDFYYDKLFSDNQDDIIFATRRLGNYEGQLGLLEPNLSLDYTPDEKHIKSFQIMMHYSKNKFFITDNEILNNISKITHIPLTIVHNRLDLVCLLDGAWALHKAHPTSNIIIVPEIGHWSDGMGKVLSDLINQ